MQVPAKEEERAKERASAPLDTFKRHVGPVFAQKSQTYSIGSTTTPTKGCTITTFTHYRKVMGKLDLNRNFDVHRGPDNQVSPRVPA